MSRELKPCPFCGRKAKVDEFCDDNGIYYVVVCETEGCRGSEDYSWSEEKSRTKAIDDWNRRS